MVCFADYPEEQIPENPRLLYVMCLLDLDRQDVGRCWLVPSPDFNHSAYRQHKASEPARVVLQFSCRLSGDPTWNRFELTPVDLGQRLLDIVESTPDTAAPDLPAEANLLRLHLRRA